MLWKFSKVYNPQRQIQDHRRDVRYLMGLPTHIQKPDPSQLFVHIQQPVTA
jgi:magnesium-protoporphyrin IX monomethyl ester (oxidative) cyclase